MAFQASFYNVVLVLALYLTVNVWAYPLPSNTSGVFGFYNSTLPNRFSNHTRPRRPVRNYTAKRIAGFNSKNSSYAFNTTSLYGNHLTHVLSKRSFDEKPLNASSHPYNSSITFLNDDNNNVVEYYFPGMIAINTKEEGKNILNQYWDRLWDDNTNQFFSSSDCGEERKTGDVWSAAVAIQSFVDAEKTFPGEFRERLSKVNDFLETYYNADRGAYSASQNKDEDLYYDDNAQIASALITAYEATSEPWYLERGETVTKFLLTGWNNASGGVTWHLNEPYVASISTTEAALAALRLYRNNHNITYLKFAENCMTWLRANLWNSSTNLLHDGVNGTDINFSHFSYHIGTALSACVSLYKETKKETWALTAHQLASAGTNRGLWIYNRDYQNKFRWWRDELDFNQLLFEGLVDYYHSEMNQSASIFDEISREARYTYDFARGEDELYFGYVDPTGNSEEIYDKWLDATNTNQTLNLTESQYCGNDVYSFPKRTLLTQASAARIFLLASQVKEVI